MTTDTGSRTTPDQNPLDLWRQFITDSERQWNAFFKDVLGTDSFSTSMNAWVEASLTVQRMIADQLERFYTAFNIPSHSDLVDLGERMKSIEDSLISLQDQVRALKPARAGKRAAAARPKPSRTRKPPQMANTNGAN